MFKFETMQIEQIVAMCSPNCGPTRAVQDALEMLAQAPTLKKIYIQCPDVIVTVERKPK